MSQPPVSIPRRHDLDALRAIAMLLGIALHGALAYIALPTGGWSVQDPQQSEGFGVFMSVVHGFRMPLFFLISGFFTAMLWRKRGLESLLMNRFKRIFIPLVIGMFTIVPAVWFVSIGAGMPGAGAVPRTADTDLWLATKQRKIEAVKQHLAAGESPDQRDAAYGTTPLSAAAWNGDTEVMDLLIEAGADVNERNRDGSTAMHGAAMLGQADAVRLLIENGADRDVVDKKGNNIADTAQLDIGTTQFLAGMLQVQFTPDAAIAGRAEILPMLEADSSDLVVEAADKPDVEPAAERDAGREALWGLVMLLVFFPFFHHLWFLWFLCWLVAAFAMYAITIGKLGWRLPRFLVVSRARYLWLIPLTMLPQATMGLMYPNFGPDTSVGLLPMPNVMLYYVIFFFFGAFYFDSDDQEGRVGQSWKITLPICLFLIFPIGYELSIGGFGFGYDLFDARYHRPVAIVLQVIYVWVMSFALMGMFRSLFSRQSHAMRYISDSSYWLYLIHLPLIIVAQAMVRDLPLPALVKFTSVCVLTTLVSLASYQMFVRYTPIGTLLNGPRVRPANPPATAELVT